MFPKNLADYKVYTFLPSAESNHITNPFLSAEILAKTEVASSVPVVIGVNNIEGYVVVIGESFSKIVITNRKFVLWFCIFLTRQ